MEMVFAAPYAPPGLAPSPFQATPMSWTGWDGSVWSLTDRRQGLYLREGVRGLSAPTHERFSSKAPGLPGSRHKGHRVEDREVFWPLRLWSDEGSEGFVIRDRAFWRTMDPDRPGTWKVEVPGSGARYLTCRFDSEEGGNEVSPVYRGWAVYGMRMLADSPYWFGDAVRRVWKQSDPVNFYGGASGFAPDFHISSASQLSTAKMDNPGDVPAYPVWDALGPFTSVTVGVEGGTTTYAATVPEGKAVRFITDPAVGPRATLGDLIPYANGYATDERGSYIIENGVDVTTGLSPTSSFNPIPDGTAAVLSLAMSGTGQVMAEITPRYRRAW